MNDYLASVAAPLRGPRRLRRDMLDELDDGFTEAVADQLELGYGREEALKRTEAEFGDPGLVAAEFQRELTAVQTRRTSWTLLIALPAMTIMWDLFGGEGEPGLAVTLLARLTDAATATAFIAAALVVTGRLERRGALVCGSLGLAHPVVAAGTSLGIAAIADPGGTPAALPYLVAASAIGTAWVVASAARALRVGATPVVGPRVLTPVGPRPRGGGPPRPVNPRKRPRDDKGAARGRIQILRPCTARQPAQVRLSAVRGLV